MATDRAVIEMMMCVCHVIFISAWHMCSTVIFPHLFICLLKTKQMAVGAGLRLSCLGSSLGGILELKEKESRQKRERDMEPRQDSDQGSTLMAADTLYKGEGRPIPSHAKFLVKLSELPFSRNSRKSQFSVNFGKPWRTCLTSGR